MRRAVTVALALALASSVGYAQPVRVRARLGRFGALLVTTCPGDPPADEWRRRVQEEFSDPTFTLYEPSAETSAIHADLRVVLRAARCTENAEAYELFMTDGRGEAAQTVMLRMGGVPRDDRPQVAALRVAEVFRTHRAALVGADPLAPVVDIPPSRQELVATSIALDLEAGFALRVLPSSGGSVGGPQIALGLRPTPTSRHRVRFELGTTVMIISAQRSEAAFGYYRTWLACGWTGTVLRSRWAELGLGARGEFAMNAAYPTLTLGGTVEGQFAVGDGVWLWTRADVGWHVIGAQVQFEVPLGPDYSLPFRVNIAEGFTAAFTVGARFAL